ncbi:Plasma membrane iron permease [Cladophialophora carrionii]|uniref:Plasma membrane iron permease n=1 Tax=Cladophialophora carrionii TaxID=86049 RepID=A0A1C1CNQ9_9EURO|nr:Plasma membrane iron permease [Cladophialophora carrionii]
MPDVFAVPVFFIVFRETLETTIVVSVLLSFLKQQLGPDKDRTVYKKLRNQVWYGVLVGFVICLIIGCGMIGAFYGIGTDSWGSAEDIWEGVFALVASIIIALMGAALLRISKMQAKWKVKLAKALEAKDNKHARFGNRFKAWAEKYAMFLLPFITVLREGIEAIVFVGGVSLGVQASSIPLPTVCGLLAGCAVGFLIYKGGNQAPLQLFLIASTSFLYLVAAGLFSRSIWYFETDAWNKATGGDASENGSGPGSYDIRRSVWHVNCCNPELNGGGGWGIFNALLGWQNSATYGSVIGYNVFWIVTIIGFVVMRFQEKKGHLPFMKKNAGDGPMIDRKTSDDESSSVGHEEEKGLAGKSKEVDSHA